MARNDTVWGIDIGNSSLKALRCRIASESDRIEAVGFDYIEHSKILSQPGAEPAEIMAETLKEFLARNSIKGDRVAITVSGQNTISRFFKLPPVDAKKIPDIIKYEAKQWLPFDLQDVVWDYQPIGKDLASTGIVLDKEVGMFAMKRDIALRTVAPYINAGINVDCIQSSPLAVYNYVAFDQLQLDKEEIDPDNPPNHVVVLCVGTDATDVIITNGITIWTRSIPIGGNMFTKAMTKAFKLTFTKAEYLKRNAATAQDPKAVFQAMRPVFNDMLSEVHRSLEYFQSLNRKAKFGKILALGNALKMPGLKQFLSQNLGYEVITPNVFNRMTGADVVNAPVFKENIGSFGLSYGLALQLLNEASISTNLMPRDIITERKIKEKKPWMLAAAATVLLGLTLSYAGATQALVGIQRSDYSTAQTKAEGVEKKSSDLNAKANKSATEFLDVDNVGKNLTGSVEGRVIWLEFLTALNAAIPDEELVLPDNTEERTDVIAKQNRLYIQCIDTRQIDDPSSWWLQMKDNRWYIPEAEELAAAKKAAEEAGTSGATAGAGKAGAKGASTAKTGAAKTGSTAAKTPAKPAMGGMSRPGMSGMSGMGAGRPGASSAASESQERQDLDLLPDPPTPLAGQPLRLVQLTGYHYHNSEEDKDNYASAYIRNTFCKNLKEGGVVLPVSMNRQLLNSSEQTETEFVSFKDLGFMYPVVLNPDKPQRITVLDPKAVQEQHLQYQMDQLQRKSGAGGIGRGSSGIGGTMGGSPGMGGGGMDMMSGGMGMPGAGGMGAPGGGMGGSMMGGMGGGSYGSNYTGIQGGPGGSGGLGLNQMANQMSDDQKIDILVYKFIVQFLWYETPPSERDRLKEEAAAAKEKAAATGTSGSGTAASPAANVGNVSIPDATDPGTAPVASTVGTPATTDDAAATSPDGAAVVPGAVPTNTPDTAAVPATGPDTATAPAAN
ncbi:MAG: pilus assembly protein PilM [Thermoguttaceae bacterium]